VATAITLSGGGAAGDFQVGALRFLYDHGVVPDIICGTSVGAINAVKLAEGEDPANPGQGLAGLEAIWGSLRFDSDMYLPEPWLYDPGMDARVRDFFLGRRSDLGIEAAADCDSWECKLSQLLWLWDDGRALLQSLSVFLTRARSLYNLSPIAERLAADLAPDKVREWVATGKRLRLAIVGLESGRLRYATESFSVVERDGTTPVVVPGDMPVACRQIQDDLGRAEGRLDDLRHELVNGDMDEIGARIRDARKGIDRLFKALEPCMLGSPGGPVPLHLTDLIPAVLASAAIPGVFPPVVFGEETWVDGGVREILPLQAAIDLGAGTVYAISASPPEEAYCDPTPRRTPYSWSKIPVVVDRAVRGIIPKEIARNDLRATKPGGEPFRLFLIQPDCELHSSTTIDPGLIQIARDYGFMRAADAVAGAEPASDLYRSSTDIARHRLRTWTAEIYDAGRRDPRFPADPPRPPDADIDALKEQLRELLDRRASFGAAINERLDKPLTWLPANVYRWVTEPELHSPLLSSDDEPEDCQGFRDQLRGITVEIAVKLKGLQSDPGNRDSHTNAIKTLRQNQERLSRELEVRGCDVF